MKKCDYCKRVDFDLVTYYNDEGGQTGVYCDDKCKDRDYGYPVKGAMPHRPKRVNVKRTVVHPWGLPKLAR